MARIRGTVKVTLLAVATSLSLLSCSGSGAARPPSAGPALTIGTIQLTTGDADMTLTLELRNNSDRTVHAYRTVRRTQYDTSTRTLSVKLLDEPPGSSYLTSLFVLPDFITIGPHSTATIAPTLPRIITRIPPGASATSGQIETVPIFQAEQVDVQVAWATEPFRPDTRSGAAPVQAQLAQWPRGHAGGHAQVHP